MTTPFKEFETEENLHFSALRESEIDDLMNFHDNECINWNFLFTKKEVKNRFKHGHKCYVAKNEGKIVGMYWLAPQNVYSPDFKSTFYVQTDGSAIEYNGYVHEEFRGKNILPVLRQIAFKDFSSKGFSCSYGYSLSTNTAVNRSGLKCNSEVEGKFTYGCILGYQYMFLNIAENCNLRIKKEFDPWQRWKRRY